MIKTSDIGWVAGIIEGEGCLRQTNGKYKTPRIIVKMTDEDVVKRFADITGAAFRPVSHGKAGKPHWKPQWAADLTGEKAFQWLMTVYVLLGERRQAKAKQLITEYRDRPVFNHGSAQQAKTHCPQGHEYTEENTRYSHPSKPWRSCRICHREGMRTSQVGQVQSCPAP